MKLVSDYPRAIVVEGIYVEDIFELVSLVFSFIISWTFRILAHEGDQYTVFLSIALKQTKAGSRSLGTLILASSFFCFKLAVAYKTADGLIFIVTATC